MSLGTLTARVALDTTPLAAGVKTAALAFGAVAAGAAAAIYKVGAAYEQSLNTFQAVSSASAAQMAQVSAAAKSLGADMALPATSAADAAAAMTELAKAGLSVDDTLKAARGTLQLAAAAQISEADAARIAAGALNAFGLAGSEATRVADLLAGASIAASGEVTDMAYAMQMSAAVFSAAGVPVEDLTAAISLMAKNAIIGSDAGTSLKSMMLALQAPSKKASATFEELGLSIYDSTGSMVDLRTIIERLRTSLKGLNEEQRNKALADIFGSDGIRAANILLKEGVEGFDKMKDAVTRQGAASELAAAKMKGLKGAFEGLKSQLEGVAISIYEKVSPAIERFVRSVAEGIPGVVAQLAVGGRAFQAAFSGEGITSDGFVGVMERIGVAARGLVDWFRENWPQIKEIGEGALNALKGAAELVVPVIRVFTEIVKDIVANAPAVKGALDGIGEAFSAIGRFIGDHIEGFTQLAELIGVIMVARLVALQAQALITFGASTIAAITGYTTATTAAGVATAGVGAAGSGGLAMAASTAFAQVAILTAGIVTLARTINDRVPVLESLDRAFISWEQRIPIVGGFLADLDRKVLGLGDSSNDTEGDVRSLQERLVDYARGYEATVTIDASQAYRTLGQLKAELATVNANMARSGPGGGNRAAANDLESRIADNEGYTGSEAAHSPEMASGGIIGAASGLMRGFKTNGPKVLVGEGNPSFPEYVIATDPLYRLRNLGLLNQAARAMGADTGGQSGGSTITITPAPVTVLLDGKAIASGTATFMAKEFYDMRRR